MTAAGVNSALSLEGGGSESRVIVDGRPIPRPGTAGTATLFQASSPDYLRAMGVRLLRGRDFSDRDTAAAPVVRR